MNKFNCILKLKDPSPKYGCKEMKIGITDHTLNCAIRTVQFEYPEYYILKIEKVSVK